jgi:hypothetical protein
MAETMGLRKPELGPAEETRHEKKDAESKYVPVKGRRTPNRWSVKVSKRKPLPQANDIRRFGLICIAHRRNADAGHQDQIPSSLLSERVKPPLALLSECDFANDKRKCKQNPPRSPAGSFHSGIVWRLDGLSCLTMCRVVADLLLGTRIVADGSPAWNRILGESRS